MASTVGKGHGGYSCQICVIKFKSRIIFPSRKLFELHMLSHPGKKLPVENNEASSSGAPKEVGNKIAPSPNESEDSHGDKEESISPNVEEFLLSKKFTNSVSKLMVQGENNVAPDMKEDNCGAEIAKLECVEDEIKPQPEPTISIKIPKKLRGPGKKLKEKTEYKCDHCQKLFRKKQNLGLHVTRIHFPENIKRLPCNHCTKTFTNKNHLKLHTRIHTGEKPYLCEHCPKRFTQSSEAVVHRRTHTGEKPYACDECNRCFSQLGALKVHKNTHLQVRPTPVLCQECPNAFSSKYALKSHMKVHTGEKPYKCSTCHKTFAHGPALTLHVRRHTGERPYPCGSCPSAFVNIGELKRHTMTHTGERPYQCEVCSKSFKTMNHLQRHLENVHIEKDRKQKKLQEWIQTL